MHRCQPGLTRRQFGPKGGNRFELLPVGFGAEAALTAERAGISGRKQPDAL